LTDEKAILLLVNRLYAAAAASDQWTHALQSLIEVMGANHAILYGGGAKEDGGFIASAGVEPKKLLHVTSPEALQMAAPYFQHGSRAGDVVGLADVTSKRDWERSPYYNEFVRPIGGYYGLAAGRLQYPSDPFTLGVCRSRDAPDFDAAAIATLRSLLPHVATAVELRLRLHRAASNGAGFTRLLDRLDAGVILACETARPVFANERARRIAGEADGLYLHDDGVAGATPAQTQALREAIAMCAQAPANRQRIRLDRPSQRPPLLLSVLPLSGLGVAVPGARVPRVAVFITEPDAPTAVNGLALADVYRLTQRECTVALLLADGLTLDAIATHLGVGRGTVRSHLAHLFDKTGAHSQAALVALVRGFAEVCR
jgi:DNA-binding CsgD family transcriptional regulator/PAS domain-containing protein